MEYTPFLCKDRRENTWHLINVAMNMIVELMMRMIELIMMLIDIMLVLRTVITADVM